MPTQAPGFAIKEQISLRTGYQQSERDWQLESFARILLAVMSRGDWLTASAVNGCFLNCSFCEIRITAAILLMYWKTMTPFSVNFPMDSKQ